MGSFKNSTSECAARETAFNGRHPLPELYRDGYGFVPTAVMESRSLSLKAKVLFCAYASYAGTRPGGLCYCSWATLAKTLHLSENTLRAAREELVACGLVEQVRHPAKGAAIKLRAAALPHAGRVGGIVPKSIIESSSLTLADKGVFALVAVKSVEQRGWACKLSYARATETLRIGKSTFSRSIKSLERKGAVRRRGEGRYIASTGLPAAAFCPAREGRAERGALEVRGGQAGQARQTPGERGARKSCSVMLPDELREPFERLCELSVNRNRLQDAADAYAHLVIEKKYEPEVIEKAYRTYVECKRDREGTPDKFFPRLENWLDPSRGANCCKDWLADAKRTLLYNRRRKERIARAQEQQAQGDVPNRGHEGEIEGNSEKAPTTERLEKLLEERSALVAKIREAGLLAGKDLVAAMVQISDQIKEEEERAKELFSHAVSSPEAAGGQSCSCGKAVLRSRPNNDSRNNDTQNGACAPRAGVGCEENEPKGEGTAPISMPANPANPSPVPTPRPSERPFDLESQPIPASRGGHEPENEPAPLNERDTGRDSVMPGGAESAQADALPALRHMAEHENKAPRQQIAGEAGDQGTGSATAKRRGLARDIGAKGEERGRSSSNKTDCRASGTIRAAALELALLAAFSARNRIEPAARSALRNASLARGTPFVVYDDGIAPDSPRKRQETIPSPPPPSAGRRSARRRPLPHQGRGRDG